jgi:Xaa-Pro aminopeptidase
VPARIRRADDAERYRLRDVMRPTPSSPTIFRARRERLLGALGHKPALLPAGAIRSKNYPDNTYPFRAGSHFLYFLGVSIPDAVLLFAESEVTLFAPSPDPSAALWHGPSPGLDELGSVLGIRVRRTAELAARVRDLSSEIATVSPNDDVTANWLSELLGRRIEPRAGARVVDGTPDAALAEALVTVRLSHDESAAAQLRQAAAATALAHAAGMRATQPGLHEADVMAAMVAAIYASGMALSYEPIVTVHGEVLHNQAYGNPIAPGDLLLADVGAETPEGWAGDVTRTWPASGRYSGTQRALYDVVLEAQRLAISLARPKTRYRAIHEATARRMLEGLVHLGIFRGAVDGLVERGAHALFFPHGVGHLLGLDVHDMEDLGDRAGYAQGRTRSARFGDRYLRLDRDLVPGMAVTIEPGFYNVPGILNDATLTAPFRDDLDRNKLLAFGDVRGIRIEDDVLVTDGEPEVLTAAIPKAPSDIEAAMRS